MPAALPTVARYQEMTVADRRLLDRVALLASLGINASQQVKEAARVRVYPRGTEIIREGSKLNDLYLVVSGQVELYKSHEDKRVSMRIAEPGDLLGVANALSDDQQMFAARAVRGARVIALPAEPFRAMLQGKCPDAVGIIQQMTCDLEHLANMLVGRERLSTEQRLAAYLLERVHHAEGNEAKVDRLQLPAAKATIAAHLGMTPESLSRAFTKLRDLGVETRARWVRIPDPSRLAEILPQG